MVLISNILLQQLNEESHQQVGKGRKKTKFSMLNPLALENKWHKALTLNAAHLALIP